MRRTEEQAMSSEAWPWRRCLAEDGIILFVNPEGRLQSRWPIEDPAVKAWIAEHKNEILEEFKKEASRHETK